MLRMFTLPCLLASAHSRACRLPVAIPCSGIPSLAQHLMYARFLLRRILAPPASACPPIVETPTDVLHTQGPLPTISPAATGSRVVLAKFAGVTQASPALTPPHMGAQTCSGRMNSAPMFSSLNGLLPVSTTETTLLVTAVQLTTLATLGKEFADGACLSLRMLKQTSCAVTATPSWKKMSPRRFQVWVERFVLPSKLVEWLVVIQSMQ